MLTLDFDDLREGEQKPRSNHYAFLASNEEFDDILGRIKEEGVVYGSGPGSRTDGEINHRHQGRGFYFRMRERPRLGSHHPHVHHQLAGQLTTTAREGNAPWTTQHARHWKPTDSSISRPPGRKSGKPHRKEVRLRQLDGQLYLSNNPGARDWAANLFANPEFTLPPEAERAARPAGASDAGARCRREARAPHAYPRERGRAGYGGGARRGQPPLPYRRAGLEGGLRGISRPYSTLGSKWHRSHGPV